MCSFLDLACFDDMQLAKEGGLTRAFAVRAGTSQGGALVPHLYDMAPGAPGVHIVRPSRVVRELELAQMIASSHFSPHEKRKWWAHPDT
jgi:hypothetical protein